MSRSLAAYGVSEIVDENMANAARVHAVERGKAVADYTLIAFGGAAPLHVARLAEKLGIARIIVPPNAGRRLGGRLSARAGRLRGGPQPLYAARLPRSSTPPTELLHDMRAEALTVVAPVPAMRRSSSSASPSCAMSARATRSWCRCRLVI